MKTGEVVKNIKDSINIKTLIIFISGFAVGIIISFIFSGFTNETLNVLKAISIIFVGFSLLLAMYQLKNSNEWNKKQLATTRLHESEKNIKTSIAGLHSALNVVNRDITKPYEVYEIHNKLGVFLKDGKTFIFHGEQTDNDIKILPDDEKQKENHINKFDHDIKGRDIRDNIISLLNEYEYISSSVNCNIFDKESVTRLVDLKLLRTYLKFQKYINHLRDHHGGGNTTYIEFEKFAREIAKSDSAKDLDIKFY
ncbi:MAG TPA: hypothetical protein DCF41_00260 [Arcobacter skirrowii]|nr:hypothetical protein [Aliarcobacter skirrowii]